MLAQYTTEMGANAADSTHAAKPTSQGLLRADGLWKAFRSGPTQVTALANVSLVIARGEMVAIVGPSGAGKSTLLHLLGALDTPTSGTVYFDGDSLGQIANSGLADYRSRVVGVVWQRHHLLPDFTAAENVAMPLLVRGIKLEAALGTAGEWLEEVGLSDRAQHRAAELSGGEQQRVAIARALVCRPQLLLADEPTGDLDAGNAETVFELIERLHRSYRLTSVLATHNLTLARRADRVLTLEGGVLRSAEGSAGGQTTSGASGVGAEARGERG